MIKLIIFDLWQTLVHREVNFSISSEILDKFNVNLSKEELIKVFEKSIQTKKWKSEYDAFKNLGKNLGIETNKETINLMMSLRDYSDSKGELYPHVISMIKQLKINGYKIGLLSNSSVFDIDYIKKRTKLLELIDYPLFSYDVGVIKPDLKFYKKMLKISKCRPEEAIMIGDKKDDDVIPPRSIGMNAIHYKNYAQLKKELKKFSIILK